MKLPSVILLALLSVLDYGDSCHPVAVPAMAPAAGQLGVGLAGLGAATLELQKGLQRMNGFNSGFNFGGGEVYRPPDVHLPPSVRNYPPPPPQVPKVTPKPEKPPVPPPQTPEKEINDPKPQEEPGKRPGKDTEPRKPGVIPVPPIDVGVDVEKEKRTTTTKPGCLLRLNADTGNRTALLLKPSGSFDAHRFVLPEIQSDSLLFDSKESILLACPGDANSLVIDGKETSYKQIMAQCDTGKKFRVDGSSTDFSNIKCKQTPESSVVDAGKCQNGLHNKYAIGFQLATITRRSTNGPPLGFLSLIEVCYDDVKHNTLYTKFNVMKGVENRQKNVQRSSYWNKDSVDHSVPYEIMYNCLSGQFPTFESILGSKELAERYIRCNTEGAKFLAKGHLAAYSDFVFYSQQKATMHYVNTSPQWQMFNTGNWKTLEDRIRKYAGVHNNDLTVYAGTHNVLKLADKDNVGQDIYLGKDVNNNFIVPVPDQMYRVVYDQTMSRATVFLGVNNVDKNVNATNYTICQDVCEQTLSFFTGWNRFDVTKGFIYCCTLQDFFSKTGLAFSEANLPLLI